MVVSLICIITTCLTKLILDHVVRIGEGAGFIYVSNASTDVREIGEVTSSEFVIRIRYIVDIVILGRSLILATAPLLRLLALLMEVLEVLRAVHEFTTALHHVFVLVGLCILIEIVVEFVIARLT